MLKVEEKIMFKDFIEEIKNFQLVQLENLKREGEGAEIYDPDQLDRIDSETDSYQTAFTLLEKIEPYSEFLLLKIVDNDKKSFELFGLSERKDSDFENDILFIEQYEGEMNVDNYRYLWEEVKMYDLLSLPDDFNVANLSIIDDIMDLDDAEYEIGSWVLCLDY